MASQAIHDVFIFNSQQQLLLTDENTLPQLTTSPHFWQICEPINQAVRQHFNIDVVTLRCLNAQFSEADNHYTYHLIHRSGQPTTGHWVAISDLDDTLSIQAQNALKSRPNQPEWYTIEWCKRLDELFPDAMIEQVRSWERSSIWRIHLSQEIHYLKAIPAMFHYESQLSRWLAQQFPMLIPKSKIIDDNIMLTPQYQGQQLDESIPIEIWEAVLSAYAKLQIQTMDKQAEIHQLGVPIRDMNWFATNLEYLICDDNTLQIGSNPLTDDEVQQLRKLYSQIKPHIENLDGFLSLEHGDLWNGQVFVDSNHHITLTDFSDAAITHPFFSLIFFLWDIETTLSHETDVVERLTTAYLKPFKHLMDSSRLMTMLDSAQLISPLYSAVRYHTDILPRLTYQWEMENMLPFNLRIALDTAKSKSMI